MDSISTVLFFHTRFKGQKKLEEEMKSVINLVDERVSDIKLFIQSMK